MPLNQENKVSTGSLPASANGTTSSTAVAVCAVPAAHGDCRRLREESRPGSSPSQLSE